MAFSDYGTGPTYSPGSFTDSFITRLGTVADTYLAAQKATNYDATAQTSESFIVRMGRRPYGPTDDLDVIDISQSVAVLGQTIAPVSAYQSNVTWGEDKTNQGLHDKAQLDYRVYALKNKTAQLDRERVQKTANQETEQTHKSSEAVYSRAHKLDLVSNLVYGQFVWEAEEAVLDRAAEVTLTNTALGEKTLIEQEKLDGKERLKYLENNLEIWKLNSEWMEVIGANIIQEWSVASGVPMFWDPTTGELSTTNPW